MYCHCSERTGLVSYGWHMTDKWFVEVCKCGMVTQIFLEQCLYGTIIVCILFNCHVKAYRRWHFLNNYGRGISHIMGSQQVCWDLLKSKRSHTWGLYCRGTRVSVLLSVMLLESMGSLRVGCGGPDGTSTSAFLSRSFLRCPTRSLSLA
jgi:hypothetical protein